MQSSLTVHTRVVSSDGCAHPFRNLPSHLVHVIESISFNASYRRKTKLFVEGQKPRGVFILRTGKAKLSTCSALGKTIITRLAEPGDVLGLSAVVSDRPYGATAEMMDSGEADFIRQDSLVRLMREHHDFALEVAEQLSEGYYPLHDAIRSLGLAIHPVERLAKLLLSWTGVDSEDAGTSDHSFKLPFTHQEIADRIGATRETVSKLFSELRRKHLLGSEGGKMIVINRTELQRIVQF
jgi:CRP/FNR family transcriptional regulator, cyclic AMP receptor protein